MKRKVVHCVTIDVFGDHSACCSMSSDRIHRHNRVRNLLDKIAQEGMLSSIMEKKGILGDVDGRRPRDVTIPVWRANKGLAIDVAVTSPLVSCNINDPDPCESYAAMRIMTTILKVLLSSLPMV